jgi:hypothetical protein
MQRNHDANRVCDANERNKIEGKKKGKTETTSAGDVQKHKTKEGRDRFTMSNSEFSLAFVLFKFSFTLLAQFYNVCRNYNLD